jgi:beta-carotene hydroxylase
MRLRNAADWRTLLWVFVLTPGTVAAQYANPALLPYLSWLSFYFAVASAVIAHNHQHCPTFVSKRWSQFMGDWISIFYGYPTFAWVPTHNLNHHRLVNKPGDATITWRFTNSHNLLVAVTYFFVSAYYQAEPINQFIRKARENKPELFRGILRQYAVFALAHTLLLGLAIALHGLAVGVTVWLLTLGLPAFFALWTVMLFNYEQHVHTDPWSKYNHSRNFEGKLLNFLLFNNGLHTAHHEKADLHWSELRRAHTKIAPHIDPALRQRSLWWYWLKQYVLSPVFPSLGTRQVGRAPFDLPDGSQVMLRTEEVAAVDMGTNALRS